MQRPSKRSTLICGGFFAIGFILAMALTAGFSIWMLNRSRGAVQSGIIRDLSSSALLLDTVDKRPSSLVKQITSDARLNSLTVAAAFDTLDLDHQHVVLNLFTMLNHSPTVRAERNRYTDTVLLARVMVLCTRRSANPGYVMYDKDYGVRINVPDWVVDPSAEPPSAEPDIPIQWYSQPRPVVTAAVRSRWTELHEWVKANQACIVKQEATPRTPRPATRALSTPCRANGVASAAAARQGARRSARGFRGQAAGFESTASRRARLSFGQHSSRS